MRFKRSLQYEQGLKQIDIAPLINVAFLLLIFILLIVFFAGLPGIKVNLPGVVTSASFKTRSVDLSVNKAGEIFYQGKEVPMAQLRDLLNQFPLSKTAVLIKADKAAPLTSVMQIWKVCQESGLQQVNIATTKE